MLHLVTLLCCWTLLAVLPTTGYAADRPLGLQIQHRESVVHLNSGCTGVVVEPSGYILTVKHCVSGNGCTVEFADGTKAEAKLVYQAPQSDGPAVYKTVQDGNYAAVEVAPDFPVIGSDIYAIGFPDGNLSATSGKIVGCESYHLDRDTFVPTTQGDRFNIGSFNARPGFSGSPVFDSEDRVMGLICGSGDQPHTIMAGHIQLMEAMKCLPGRRGTSGKGIQAELLVFTAKWCQPCQKFHSDWEGNRRFRTGIEESLKVTFYDADKDTDQMSKWAVDGVPTFLVVHNGTEVDRRKGYKNPQELADWLQSLAPASSDSGEGGYTPLPDKQPEAVPEPQEEAVEGTLDPEGLSLVVLFKKRDTADVKDLVLGLAPAAMQRALERGLNGKATVKVVSERAAPDQYEAICTQMGVAPENAYCFVLVPKTNKGFTKGLMVKMLEGVLEKKLETAAMPVEPVFERTHSNDYHTLIDMADAAPKTTLLESLKGKAWEILLSVLLGERASAYLWAIVTFSKEKFWSVVDRRYKRKEEQPVEAAVGPAPVAP